MASHNAVVLLVSLAVISCVIAEEIPREVSPKFNAIFEQIGKMLSGAEGEIEDKLGEKGKDGTYDDADDETQFAVIVDAGSSGILVKLLKLNLL